ncbi:MAG: TatD family hydrolase [Bacteroidales bacterium]|nr:TatD family hydrolase [Bacteroidales bacterium]
MIDSHCHIYLDEFLNDRSEAINRAISSGITHMVLPNIDNSSINQMTELSSQYPDIFINTLGLHPTSVKSDYKEQLEIIFSNHILINGIGETGIDLYWDKTYLKEQQESFDYQLDKACNLKLPIIIHSRNSLNEVIDIVKNYVSKGITGVFHCFPGNAEEAKKIIDFGFYLGIGGVVTYKNSNMKEVVSAIPLEHILTETDSPYLTPVPFRGKRNEPYYLKYIIEKIAEIKNCDKNTVNNITTENCKRLFKLNNSK